MGSGRPQVAKEATGKRGAATATTQDDPGTRSLLALKRILGSLGR